MIAPRLIAITNRHLAGGLDALPQAVNDLINWGVPAILLREKDLPARQIAALAATLLAITRPAGAQLLIADRLDVALALGADGAHLATHSLATADARRILPPTFLLGASCHNLPELQAAQTGGADYALLSPIFPPNSKTTAALNLGLQQLHHLSTCVQIPVLALGGITDANVPSVLATGAFGVAAIGAFFPPREATVRAIVAACHRNP